MKTILALMLLATPVLAADKKPPNNPTDIAIAEYNRCLEQRAAERRGKPPGSVPLRRCVLSDFRPKK